MVQGALTIIQDRTIPRLHAKKEEKQSRRRIKITEERYAQAKRRAMQGMRKRRRRGREDEGEAQATNEQHNNEDREAHAQKKDDAR